LTVPRHPEHTEELVNDRGIARALTWRYVIALSLVASLSTAAWVSLHLVISEQKSTAAVVNVSGRQRMLSQRTALFSNLLLNTAKPERSIIRAKLKESIELMARSHHGLIHGDTQMGLPESMSPAVRYLYFNGANALDGQVETYIKTVQALLLVDEGSLTTDNPLLEYITRVAPTTLVTALDQMVRQYQLEGEASVGHVQQAETIFWLLTLLLLILEAVLIFHPFVRHVRTIISKLQGVKEALQVHQVQLLQSEKLASIGQLAAGVAHEINNPVGFVNSNLGTLQQYVTDLLSLLSAYEKCEREMSADRSAAVAELKQKIDLVFLREDINNLLAESMDGMQRVKRIVQDLKDFSHQDVSEKQSANLERGLDSTLNIIWNELKYKAEVTKEYGNIPEIECLPAQLNQVFMNLLMNAVQAIKDYGKITIRTGQQDEQVWVEVEDTGTGIQPEHLEHIFDPFFTTKPVGSGTGLGLALSYGIVKNHGGRIEVKSEPGKGSVFKVVLPHSHRL
jgi:signal transduction histidine kinase